MNRRSPLRYLLAEAQLAERDIAREQARAKRDSDNFRNATQALVSLIPAGASMIGDYGKRLEDEASRDAEAIVSENLTYAGEEGEAPEAAALRIVKADKRTAEPTSNDAMARFLDDPTGFKAMARKRAAQEAQGGLARQIKGNRDEAAKLARASAEAEAKRKHALDLAAAKNAAKAAEAEGPAFDEDTRQGMMSRGLDSVRASLDEGTNLSKPAQLEAKADAKADAARERQELQQLAAFARNPKTRALVSDEGWAQLERIGIKRPPASGSTGAPSQGPRPLTDKERRNKALADKAEADAERAQRRNEQDTASSADAGFRIDDPTRRKVQDSLSSADAAIASAEEMLAVLDDPSKARFFGKVRGNYEAAKEAAGVGSEAAGIRSNMAERYNAYKVAISGAAVSDKEKPDLTRVMPDDIDINPADLRRKLLAGIEYAKKQRARAGGILESGDIRGARPTTPAPVVPSTSPAGPALSVTDEERAAATLYRKVLTPAQRARADELARQGVDRVTAVRRALGGE